MIASNNIFTDSYRPIIVHKYSYLISKMTPGYNVAIQYNCSIKTVFCSRALKGMSTY